MKVITPPDNEYKAVILLHLNQRISRQTGHYSDIKLFNNHFLGNINLNTFKIIRPNNEIVMKDKITLNKVILYARSLNDYLKKLFIINPRNRYILFTRNILTKKG